MNFTDIKSQLSDKLSICLSICCILHCVALPIIILLLPGVASFWINNENVHIFFVLCAVPISLFAMSKSLRKHHSYKCISLAGIGLFLLVIAIFMHDLGLNAEHSHNEENGHEEHSGIGEILETIFTVMGGLILLGAHLFNIKLTKQAS